MSNQLAEALRLMVSAFDHGDVMASEGAAIAAAKQALAAHEAAQERTGWPADGRMAQDDSRELSKWLSNTPGARRLVDEVAKPDPSQLSVYIEREQVWIKRGTQFFRLAYEAETEAEREWYAGQLRKALAAPVAVASPLSDEQIEAIGHRKAWRYKHSSDPAHSSTYTFNRVCLLDFARTAIDSAHRIGASGEASNV